MGVRVLLVSNDPALCRSVSTAIEAVSNCRLDVLPGPCNADLVATGKPAALVLLHVKTAEDEQRLAELPQALAARGRSVGIVALCDSDDTAQAVRLFSYGASDCLLRPLDLRRLAMLVDVLTIRDRCLPETAARRRAPIGAVEKLGAGEPFLYTPSEMGSLIDQVRSVAPLPTTVLLHGETGTGKTRLAQLIHELSPRRTQPFVEVNCGALTPSLIESELFGHVKGAFTGAEGDRGGKFLEAGSGTLMLDDIDALPLSLQAKLLRVLDQRVFERVGSDRTETMQARLIVATNQDLEQELAAGRFRRDLYYRIQVVAIGLAPLRQRPALIQPLAEYCLDDLCKRFGRQRPVFSSQALAALKAHAWPGNVRELRNAVERALVLTSNGHIDFSDLPLDVQRSLPEPASPAVESGATGSRWLQRKVEEEAKTIRNALSQAGNNRLRAAQQLGMSRVTLYKKLRQYGLM